MRAYKGFDVAADGTISCRGHQYVEGETYTHDGPVELCESGYHACPMPLDTLRYYPLTGSVYHEVDVDDDAQGDDDKVVSSRIKIGARLSLADMITAHLDLVQDRVRRDDRHAATSGDWSTAATSGNWATAATSGYRSTAVAGGVDSIAVAGGCQCQARGALGCWLVLAERDTTGHILGVQAVPVDGDTIRADTLYMLRGGKVVEVES